MCSVILLSEVSKILVDKLVSLEIPKSKNILILGDSQTQYALDDKIIDNALNLSESADPYFYSFVKLKKIAQANPHIDTLILSFTYHNLAKKQDVWLQSSSVNGFKFPRHYFLMESDEITSFLKHSSTVFLTNYSRSVTDNLRLLAGVYRKRNITQFGLGGYVAATDNNLTIEKDTPTYEFGSKDLKYLEEIIGYCSHNNIKLILIGSPIHKKGKERYLYYKERHSSFLQKFDQVEFYDFITYPLEDSCFKDDNHLNAKGAGIFSKMIKQKLQH